MSGTSYKPRALQPGDRIRVVSPSSPIAPEKFDVATEVLEAEGYKLEIAPHAYDRSDSDEYLAGRDEDRAKDLQDAFDDDNIAAVLCARGGYGSARLIPHLDLDRMAASRKLFLGFSDITSLHLALNRRGLPTVYAPMVLTLRAKREPWVMESFKNAFKGGEPVPEDSYKGKTLVAGQAEGVVTGGCLVLMADSLGTPNSIDVDGKIVLIEDVDVFPHRVDAMLTHLILSGQLQKARGIVIGEMTRSDEVWDESIGRRPWMDIIRDRLVPLGVPTIVNFPFGHCKNMLSLPLGIRARLDATAGTLTYLEGLCE